MLAGLPSAGSATLSTRRLVECAFIAIGIISLLAFLLMQQEATAGTDAALGQAFIAIYDRAFLIGPGFFAGVAPETSSCPGSPSSPGGSLVGSGVGSPLSIDSRRKLCGLVGRPHVVPSAGIEPATHGFRKPLLLLAAFRNRRNPFRAAFPHLSDLLRRGFSSGPTRADGPKRGGAQESHPAQTSP
jgi:hypothetical protein